MEMVVHGGLDVEKDKKGKIMKEILNIISMFVICLLLINITGCGKKKEDINVVQVEYLNTSDSIEVHCNNSYQCISIDKEYDNDTGKYTVTLQFNKLN